jgi:hypothetical protein
MRTTRAQAGVATAIAINITATSPLSVRTMPSPMNQVFLQTPSG